MSLPYYMDHKENPIASWSQATNSNILVGLGWNWKGSLGIRLEKKSQVYKPWGCHFAWRCIQATLTNTSHPTSWRTAGLLYWSLDCTMWGRKARKSAWSLKSKRRVGIPGTPSPTDGILKDRRAQICQSPPLSPQWRGHFLWPLWFLSITYQKGQSVAEIKQLLKLDGLWTQQGENSLRSLISLNLKRILILERLW